MHTRAPSSALDARAYTWSAVKARFGTEPLAGCRNVPAWDGYAPATMPQQPRPSICVQSPADGKQ